MNGTAERIIRNWEKAQRWPPEVGLEACVEVVTGATGGEEACREALDVLLNCVDSEPSCLEDFNASFADSDPDGFFAKQLGIEPRKPNAELVATALESIDGLNARQIFQRWEKARELDYRSAFTFVVGFFLHVGADQDEDVVEAYRKATQILCQYLDAHSELYPVLSEVLAFQAEDVDDAEMEFGNEE